MYVYYGNCQVHDVSSDVLHGLCCAVFRCCWIEVPMMMIEVYLKQQLICLVCLEQTLNGCWHLKTFSNENQGNNLLTRL